jgi:hypothetical protein
MAFSDGGENSSAKWNGRNLSKLIISHQDLPGWTITFTGCDMSGFREMSNMKLREDRMVSYNSSEKAKAFKNMSKFVETAIKSSKQMSKTAFEKE